MNKTERKQLRHSGSKQFWTVIREGNQVIETFGVMMEKGERQVTPTSSSEEAEALLQRLLQEKQEAGYLHVSTDEFHISSESTSVIIAECELEQMVQFFASRGEIAERHQNVEARVWRQGNCWIPCDEDGELLLEVIPEAMGVFLELNSGWTVLYRERDSASGAELSWATRMSQELSAALKSQVVSANNESEQWHLFEAGELRHEILDDDFDERAELLEELDLEVPVFSTRGVKIYFSPHGKSLVKRADRCVTRYRPVESP